MYPPPPQKQALSDKTTQESSTTDKEKTSQPLQPYRRMLPGMKVKTDSDREPEEVGGDKDDAEDEEEEPSLPTPRKRLMNFKIPLVRGVGQRRGQSATVIRRRLFGGKGEECVCACVCCVMCAVWEFTKTKICVGEIVSTVHVTSSNEMLT